MTLPIRKPCARSCRGQGAAPGGSSAALARQPIPAAERFVAYHDQGVEAATLLGGDKLLAAVSGMEVSPDGKSVLGHGQDGRVRLRSSQTGLLLHEGVHGCGARDAWFWDVASGRPVSSMPSGELALFSADGRRLLGPGAGKFDAFEGIGPQGYQIWDVDTAEMRFSAPLPLGDRAGATVLDPDGTLLLAAAGQKAILGAVGGRDHSERRQGRG